MHTQTYIHNGHKIIVTVLDGNDFSRFVILDPTDNILRASEFFRASALINLPDAKLHVMTETYCRNIVDNISEKVEMS